MDVKEKALEALVIIGKGAPGALPTNHLRSLFGRAETSEKWSILATLSKRDDISVNDVLALAASYSGEIGMPVLFVAIQPKLAQMSLDDLLQKLSFYNNKRGQNVPVSDLTRSLREEIIKNRIPVAPIEVVLSIYSSDEEVEYAVKGQFHKRAAELEALAAK